MTKSITVTALAVALIASSGCMSVEKAINGMPQISAARLHTTQGTPYGSVQIDAVNVRQSDTQVTADSITVQVSVPLVGATTVHVEGYVRDKRPATEAAP